MVEMGTSAGGIIINRKKLLLWPVASLFLLDVQHMT
jgi:hypothetical protein